MTYLFIHHYNPLHEISIAFLCITWSQQFTCMQKSPNCCQIEQRKSSNKSKPSNPRKVLFFEDQMIIKSCQLGSAEKFSWRRAIEIQSQAPKKSVHSIQGYLSHRWNISQYPMISNHLYMWETQHNRQSQFFWSYHAVAFPGTIYPCLLSVSTQHHPQYMYSAHYIFVLFEWISYLNGKIR